MLAALQALDDQNRRTPGHSPEPVGRDVARLVDYVRTGLVAPYFGDFGGPDHEQDWKAFTSWAEPAVDALIDRIASTFAGEKALGEAARRADRSFGDLAGFLGSLDPDLARDFDSALKVGLKSDLILLDNLDRLVPGPNLAAQQVHLRLRGAMHFGLAFLVLAAMHQRGMAETGRASFLVQKLRKTASAALMNTFRIVKWASDGCSETLEQ